MALYRLITRHRMGAGADEDVATWSHGVTLASLPTGEELANLWSNAMASTAYGGALRSQTPGWVRRESIELAPAAGGASVVFFAMSGQLGVGSTPLASTTAIPLIAMVDGPRGPAAGARYMLGPLAGGTSNGRPSSSQWNAAIGYGRALHHALGVFGGGLVVLRNDGASSEPVTHFSVGNSFGQVSTRRLEVTSRTSVAI